MTNTATFLRGPTSTLHADDGRECARPPPEGQTAVQWDRYPSLTFPSIAKAAAASGVGFQRSSDNINVTINMTAPPGSDPRTFSGMIAMELRRSLPSAVGAAR